ncbi:hypothetical protein [Clostridium beijerinckii]|uniref:hypothetical protein n=1 Tax=Clostridium beijerinckii TaxID=1520 RepID=UPI00242DC9F6|nr:hypothetical protein [Clostridium beijerinckii]MDG5852477.1 hypothetical protein [Clostridium beijerinckii]
MKNKISWYNIVNRIIETCALLSIMIFIGFVIWRLTGTMNYSSVSIEATNNYTNDQINMIMTATDNAINKIYNTLVVSTIFFTILVAAISIFQFIKIRDVDNLKREIIAKSEQYQEEIKLQIEDNDKKFIGIQNEYSEKFNEFISSYEGEIYKINLVIEKLNKKSSELDTKSFEFDRKNALLQLEIYKIKIQETINNNYKFSHEMIMESLAIINLAEENPEYIDNESLGEVYLIISRMYINGLNGKGFTIYEQVYEIVLGYLNKVLKICSNMGKKFQAYTNLAELEMVCNGDVEQAIKYRVDAKKVRYDEDNLIKLIILLDKRNREIDLRNAYNYFRELMENKTEGTINRLQIERMQGNLFNLEKSEYGKMLKLGNLKKK